MFYTVKDGCFAEVTEKKSKFICNIFHVESVIEAEDKLNEIRKQYYDARHNCFVYKIAEDGCFKSSDDGEPSGTAGVPMLNIVNGKNISNVLVVVTRYFGGILLGTGGLVRAYSQAISAALDNAVLIKQEEGIEAEFFVDYKQLDEVKYHFKKKNISISKMEYAEKVKLTVEGEKNVIYSLKDEKISDRVALEYVKILKKKYIEVK